MNLELKEKELNEVTGGKIDKISSDKNKFKCEPTKRPMLIKNEVGVFKGEKIVCSDPLYKNTKQECADCPARNN